MTPSEKVAKLNKLLDQTVRALADCIEFHPAFRSRPIGAPGSIARQLQMQAMEAEDNARAAIAAVREERP